MIIIFVVILLLFGAKKLPELARGVGKAMGEFKNARREFEDEIRRAEWEVQEQERRLEENKRKEQYQTANPVPASTGEAAQTAEASTSSPSPDTTETEVKTDSEHHA